MQRGKLQALQVLRALAAVLVIWLHSVTGARYQNLRVIHATYGSLGVLGATGVEVFFVLSGFVVSQSAARQHSPQIFALRRILRIYPLFWISLGLCVVLHGYDETGHSVGLAGKALWSATLLPSALPGSPFGRPIVYASWTLVFEVFFYLCLTAGLTSKRWDPRALCVAIVGSAVVVNLLLNRRLPFLVFYGNPLALEFLMGVLIGQIATRLSEFKLGALLMLSGATLLLCTAFINVDP